MKKITLACAAWTVLAFLCIETSLAQVLWYGDPNEDVRTVFRRLDPDGNSNPSGSQCVDDPNNPPTVSTPTDSNFGKYWRITKPTSRKRAEFARTNGFIPQEGQTYYIGWRWRINSTPNLNNGIAVFQWKTDPGGNTNSNKQNYAFNMGYDGNELSINAYGPAEPNWNRPGSINQRKTTIWKKNVSENSWVSLVFRVKVDRDFDNSNNRYNGFIEFWFNGSKQTLMNSDFDDYQVALSNDNKRAYHRTNDGSQVYMKWGSYNENACDYRILTDFDDMRVAETYSEARPEPAGNTGGSSIEGTYRFKNVATGQYMDSNGATIATSTSSSGSDRLWSVVESAPGLYNIDSEFSGGRGVLDTNGNGVVVGSNIEPVVTTDDKEWSVESVSGNIYRFKNNFTGRGYLAVNTSTGIVEYTTTWNGFRAQWILEPVSINLTTQLLMSDNLGDVESDFKLYPNPVSYSLRIDDVLEDMNTINVYDLSGSKVLSKNIEGNGTYSQLDVSALSKGIYVLEIIGKNETVRRKLVKE